MLYREIMAVCSEIHTKHTNKLCELNVDFLRVKLCSTGSNYFVTKSLYKKTLHCAHVVVPLIVSTVNT